MRNLTKAIAIAAMLAFPVASMAQTAPATTKQTTKAEKTEKSSTKKVATHTTKGTVKSVSDSQLVITTSGKSAKDETFVVNASTTKTGTIEAGSHVSVHYTTEGGTMTATAISASAPKASKSSSKKK